MAALFAALACVATMSIKIPTPGTSGYIHPGDAIVILAGVVLGPAWGFLAGGIGSAMADLLGGYFVYVPITFVIKGLVSLCSALLYRKVVFDMLSRRFPSEKIYPSAIICSSLGSSSERIVSA